MDKKATIAQIKEKANSGDFSGNSLPDVFARCYRAIQNTLGITPFDEQLLAALALTEGKMVQMQTGEGKTLCAVFSACYAALCKDSVHILTFNDYLARRDREWMKPVYDEMGVTTGVITEKTPRSERREIYASQVVYATAKEAGFDYLRDFVQFNTQEMTFPESLGFAIVDEADSILIDEARIPLVIAGDITVNPDSSTARVYHMTAGFDESDFELDEETQNVYLTDSGADKAERVFGTDVYAENSAPLLAKICAALKARSVLTENKDYILKDGKILIIDEYTGRTAPGRVFPGELQAAVEAKHGLKITSRGRIMGSIALQFFLRLYPRLAGMTGTAEDAADEFLKLYGLQTEIIPTHKLCIRTDRPMEMYYDAEEKRKAIVSAVKEAAERSRPVLVGTESIEESESLANELRSIGIYCRVLNAKNDEEEAAVIAGAGERGAVTISTNMAGRGVDIKLGRGDFSEKSFVESTGGLLVLATSMRESARITKQLRGRAGRQGDAGESRFFTALDDELMTRYGLKKLVSHKHYPQSKVSGAIEDKALLKEAERVQRISEGDAFDEREKLLRYTMIGEKHRELTFRRRRSLLDGSYNSDMWQKNAAPLYEKAVQKFGEAPLQQLQNEILAGLLNEFWCDYLDYTTYLREGIHLTQIAGKKPAEEYNIACEEYYDSAAESVPDRMTEKLEDVLKCERLSDYTVQKPSRIYTYLLNDTGEEFKAKPILLNLFSEEESEPDKTKEKTEGTDEAPEKKSFFGRIFGKRK